MVFDILIKIMYIPHQDTPKSTYTFQAFASYLYILHCAREACINTGKVYVGVNGALWV